MNKLNIDANLDDPDGFYAQLLALHEPLDEAASHALNAKLVLILANHIGNREVITQAFDLAFKSTPRSSHTF